MNLGWSTPSKISARSDERGDKRTYGNPIDFAVIGKRVVLVEELQSNLRRVPKGGMGPSVRNNIFEHFRESVDEWNNFIYKGHFSLRDLESGRDECLS